MKNLLLQVVAGATLLASCGSPSADQTDNKSASMDQNKPFDKYKEAFIEELWVMYPGWAASVGYHKYDNVLVVPDAAYHQKEVEFANRNLDSLKKFDLAGLNSSNKTDYHILQNTLNGIIFNVNEFKDYEWNPASYNVGSTFAEILQSKHASLDEKLRALIERMTNVPAFYENATKTIKVPTIEHTNLAISQNKGSIGVFKGMIADSLKKSGLSAEEKKKAEKAISATVKAIEGYVAWLTDLSKKLVPQDPTARYNSSAMIARDFRIGKELYEKKFQFDIVSKYSAEEIYKKAVERKNELQGKMLEITEKLFPKYFPEVRVNGPFNKTHIKMLIDEISKKHVKAEDFQSEIERQIPELTKFVADKDLIYLDPQKPLVVRKEPEYMAGVAGASISSPGPYDKGGNTYYNVGSLAGYTKEGAESYLREYNHYVLQVLNIHEAIPGHYAQLVYSNQSPSLVKSILGNGAMVEGWAVYTERMMLENGYGNDEPEMWLMYYKWHLRSVCNTILDYSIQVLGMKKEEAVKLLVEDAFQQQQEAENKWKRASLTQVQLTSYFTGYTEIYELREEMKKKEGDKFNLKKFHEKFLSYGSAPVKYIRELMMEE